MQSDELFEILHAFFEEAKSLPEDNTNYIRVR
jgi:hypothetical protein